MSALISRSGLRVGSDGLAVTVSASLSSLSFPVCSAKWPLNVSGPMLRCAALQAARSDPNA